MRDEFVKECPFCNGTEMIEAQQTDYAAVAATHNIWGGRTLYHSFITVNPAERLDYKYYFLRRLLFAKKQHIGDCGITGRL